jgi:uncharacterized protein (DUF362 family)
MNPQKQAPFVCPKTGRIIEPKPQGRFARWLWPITGLAALLWFGVRVIPKPSRASYPCQRLAAPLAFSFLTWFISLFASWAILRRAKDAWRRACYPLAVISILAGLAMLAIGSLGQPVSPVSAAVIHSDPANSPMGVARGIFPGRVAWVYNPSAATWNGVTGNWWDDNNTSQTAVDSMLSQSLRSLTGASTDSAAWEALFRNFNQRRGKGDIGYASGEKIAVKLNMNNSGSSYASNNNIDASPQLALALARQLVNQAGVSQANITFYDASRYINNNVYNKLHGEFPNLVIVDISGGSGRTKASWVNGAISYSSTNNNGTGLPTCVINASYLINMAIMKLHSTAGMTLLGKNHYGSISARNNHTVLQPKSTPSYNIQTDFMAHKDLGEKTVLFMIDALYAHNSPGGVPTDRWSIPPFYNRWPSSLFLSQDQVALDSVGYDFLSAQYPNYGLLSYADNYLHEAALANNPPSGVFYTPNGDHIQAQSLGVHEHWNNLVEKQYTRNLGTGAGIELLYQGPVSTLTQTFLPLVRR